ncbi:MAG: Succinate dehydrogenase flavoprotein subunit [Ktedonobacterales bacterium]|jgi:succinate dehydrogenase / fumarate reductase flavoprotein subunit|nr:MAG: Succinate dehydrogenase flavoprotein subunit [Ktedonobacterales bacterium]
MNYHKYDVVIVGAGGAGLMSAMQLAHNTSVAVISKLYPTRSHTGAAQGGVAAALGNQEEDHWKWHMFDTVKGGDYLVDQDAAEVLTREAIDAVYDLEHWGLPFNRTEDGKIDQRRFGGHTRNFGEGPVRRSCYAADRTGHMILQTMYQQSVKNQVKFYNEYLMLDLLINDGQACGVVALCLRDGTIHTFHAKTIVFATGGYGRAWRITSNALACTGDGMAVAYRRGIPLEDMEMYQFHPTGLYKVGILLSEAARGEGAYLLNKDGERFCVRYAPTMEELAPRDMVSRFIVQEITEGRGIDGKDYVYLSVAHLGKEKIDAKLPDITDFARNYLGVEPYYEPVPIQPTAHYAMGGIPTDIEGRVIMDENNTTLPGMYAAGEVACVSVHGANRLGTNSLVDLIVFGRRAGKHIAAKWLPEADFAPLPPNPDAWATEMVESLLARASAGAKGKGETQEAIRQDLRDSMMENAGVVRDEQHLTAQMAKVAELKERWQTMRLMDTSRTFNTELMEVIELGNLIECAEATVAGALARQESRGAHYRSDFPTRDDKNFLQHTLAFRSETAGAPELRYKPVVITEFQPKERKY